MCGPTTIRSGRKWAARGMALGKLVEKTGRAGAEESGLRERGTLGRIGTSGSTILART